MNTTSLRWFAALVAVSVVIAATSACGDDTSSDSVENQDQNFQYNDFDALDACQIDADCFEGEYCAIIADPEGSLEKACIPDNDGGEPGDSCQDDADCRSELCLDDVCSAPCTDSEQCDELQVCQESEIEKDGEEGTFDVCREIPVTSCQAPVDCEFDDTTCNMLQTDDDDQIEGAACGMTNPEQASLGASCVDGDACESDFCWSSHDGSTGECTVFCQESDRDCADGQVCAEMTAGLGACLAGCQSNLECDGRNVCQYAVDYDDDSLYQYCDHQIGDGQPGDMCQESSECDTGLCLTVATYEVTGDSCSTDGDCDDGFECRCDPDEPGCASGDEQCVSVEPTDEESRCSELCDIANGDDDCSGNDEMSRCADDIVVTWDNGDQSELISACTTPVDAEAQL